jgi:Ca2+-binding RTX toxin-like protein
MRKSVLLMVSMAAAVLLASGAAFALPSEVPDETPMLNGPVRTFAQVPGTDLLWVGGNFTQVKMRNGTLIDDVSNVAVFDSATGAYVDIAPKLGAGSTDSKVTEIKIYGDDALIGGRFAGPTNKQKNLIVVDAATGVAGAQQPRWFNSPVLEGLLAAPNLSRVYGGGVSLTAFDFESGTKLWTQATTTVDQTLRTHYLKPGYRDLERDGQTIWAACGCDAVIGPDGTPNPAKALVKLDIEGNLDTSWITQAGTGGFGISVTRTDSNLYLGAGGNDFLAEYPKANNGTRSWMRDTSGSAQVVEIMDGQLVAGGHFVEVADEARDNCGNRSSNPDTLDPNDECQTRKGLAAYTFTGSLDPTWDPALTGKYNLAWALHPEPTLQGTRLHVGGEFTHVNGITQEYYARLSDAQASPECTVTGTLSADLLEGTQADDVICGGGGSDTLRGLGGNDVLRGEGGTDKLFGGEGDDALEGGASTDTADFSGSPGRVEASLSDGTATGEGSDTLAGIENLTGTGANDTLTGSEANNTLNGGSGADGIVGLRGADVLKGAAGNDTLDSRDGVEGNDTVNGGGGTDACATDATENSITECEL